MSPPEAADRTPAAIRTPDQRLRVFISSTLVEMAEERTAARSAVEALRLAPVMFELGARPHPPRDLYRAYLRQSDVFLGLYWERYGWVAPGESVSGLEDEYNLAGPLPRLIYVKQTAGTREPRLVELLARIRNDDRASYKSFATAAELLELIEGDLATLLAERFDQSRVPEAPAAQTEEPSGTLPAPLDSLIGRERELTVVTGMLADTRVRLITLTGPGGIGKSRLAIESARQAVKTFRDGAYFVDLSAVHGPTEVLASIARTLGVRDSGDEPIQEKLDLALRHRQLLLVLDNFEHVIGAATDVTALLAAAPDITVLVTSRSPLRVRGEHLLDVLPLALPEEGESTLDQAAASPAVELFVERARAAKPDFELTELNVAAVARICRALDGLPLALELVAARIRLLPPAAMVEHLDTQLGSLIGRGIRDLPGRQQTLLSTVTWSTNLLADDEARLLAQLGVFSGGFSLEGAESVGDTDGESRDVLSLLESLVDSSLVQQEDSNAEPHFTMLATVREWARDRLIERGELEEASDRHARYCLDLCERLGPALTGADQLAASHALAAEHENIVAALTHLIASHQTDDAARLAWELWVYWWVAGHLGEVSRLMTSMLDTGDAMSEHSRAVALYYSLAIRFWRDPDDRVIPGLRQSADLFHAAEDPSGEALTRISLALALLAGDPPDPPGAVAELSTALSCFRAADDTWGEAFALITIGRAGILGGDIPGAVEHFERSLRLARAQQDRLSACIALNHLGWARFLLGDPDASAPAFVESFELSIGLGHVEGIAYGLEGFIALAASRGWGTEAGRLAGAAQSLRRQTGLFNAPTFTFHQQALAPLLATPAADDFQAGQREGLRMKVREAIDYARSLRLAEVAHVGR